MPRGTAFPFHQENCLSRVSVSLSIFLLSLENLSSVALFHSYFPNLAFFNFKSTSWLAVTPICLFCLAWYLSLLSSCCCDLCFKACSSDHFCSRSLVSERCWKQACSCLHCCSWDQRCVCPPMSLSLSQAQLCLMQQLIKVVCKLWTVQTIPVGEEVETIN